MVSSRSRNAALAGCFWILASSCALDLTGKDACLRDQDCPRGACVANRCSSASLPLDGGADPAPEAVEPIDRDSSVDVPLEPMDGADPVERPLDREETAQPMPDTDAAPVVDGPQCDASCCPSDAAVSCPEGGCEMANDCCGYCSQGCDQGECRISLVGDWGDPVGNTIQIFQNQASLLMSYTDGPHAGWDVRGRFVDRLLIEGDFLPSQTITGVVSADVTTIEWSSGGAWTKK